MSLPPPARYSRAKGHQPRFFAGGRGAAASCSSQTKPLSFSLPTMKRLVSNGKSAASPSGQVRHLGDVAAHGRLSRRTFNLCP